MEGIPAGMSGYQSKERQKYPKYFFAFRTLPSPDYVYPERFEEWEKYDKESISKISFIDKPIYMEHKVPVGKVIFEWLGKDGSLIGVAYVEGSHPIALSAIGELERGILGGVSPLYNLSVEKTPYKLNFTKEYKEMSLVLEPDFSGKGGCVIFFGMNENDLNIKLNNLIKNANTKSSTPILPNTPAKESKDFAVGLKKAIIELNDTRSKMEQHQQGQTPTQPNQQGHTAVQPQSMGGVGQPISEPQKTESELAVKTTGDLARLLNTNPASAEGLGPDEMKAAMLMLAKEVAAQKTPQTTVEPAIAGTKRKAPEQDSAQIDATNLEMYKKHAADYLESRMKNLKSVYEHISDLLPANPTTNKATALAELDAYSNQLKQDPLNPLALAGMKNLDNYNAVLAHAAMNLQRNTQVRQDVRTMQAEVDANQMRSFLKQTQGSYLANPTNSTNPTKPNLQTVVSNGANNTTYDNEVSELIWKKMTQGNAGVRILSQDVKTYTT